jgi:hypothetical protein
LPKLKKKKKPNREKENSEQAEEDKRKNHEEVMYKCGCKPSSHLGFKLASYKTHIYSQH